jgi:hypothetical protein
MVDEAAEQFDRVRAALGRLLAQQAPFGIC